MIRGSNIYATFNIGDAEIDYQEFLENLVERYRKIPRAGIASKFVGAVMNEEFAPTTGMRHLHAVIALSGQMDNAISVNEFQDPLFGGHIQTKNLEGKAIRRAEIVYLLKGRIVAKVGEDIAASYQEDKEKPPTKKEIQKDVAVESRKRIIELLKSHRYAEIQRMLASGELPIKQLEEAKRTLTAISEFDWVEQLKEVPVTLIDEAWDRPFYIRIRPETQEAYIEDMYGDVHEWNGVRGLWIYGPSGVGKSKGITLYNRYEANDGTEKKVPYYLFPYTGNFEKPYKGEQIILVDDLNTELFPTPGHFRAIMESEDFQRKYSSVKIDPDNVIWVVTANVTPEEMWPDHPQEAAAVRRNLIPVKLVTPKYKPRTRGGFGEEIRARSKPTPPSGIVPAAFEPIYAASGFEAIHPSKRPREESSDDKGYKRNPSSNLLNAGSEDLQRRDFQILDIHEAEGRQLILEGYSLAEVIQILKKRHNH